MMKATLKTKAPLQTPKAPERKQQPETPKKSRDEVLDQISQDSFLNPEEYLNNSKTPQGE